MSRAKDQAPKEAVGTTPCPVKGCDLTVDVFRYEGKGENANRRRFAGRLFCICPNHGRVENQDYLQKAVTWHAGKAPADAPPAADLPPRIQQSRDLAVSSPQKPPISKHNSQKAPPSPWFTDYTQK